MADEIIGIARGGSLMSPTPPKEHAARGGGTPGRWQRAVCGTVVRCGEKAFIATSPDACQRCKRALEKGQ